MKHDWRKVLIDKDIKIRDVLETISNASIRIALVVDENQHLLGTITDGDIRRGLLEDISLDNSIDEIINREPITAEIGTLRSELMNVMLKEEINAIPILSNKQVVGLETLEHSLSVDSRDNVALIMAGGFGKRLMPLTESTPKPLLNIGSKRIVEVIIEKLAAAGFSKFYISTFYHSEKIENYLGNGDRWNINIQYIKEEEPLGTGGALGLIPKKHKEKPILVINGDVLTNLNFSNLMEFHDNNDSAATICAKEYQTTIPYGVIESEKEKVLAIKEKPSYCHFVNSGIYVISPRLASRVEKRQKIDITTLISDAIQNSDEVRLFPVLEYWIDIGMPEDYEKAQHDLRNDHQNLK